MDCEKATYRVDGYLDGELRFYRRFFIRRHLDKCPPCAQSFDFELEVRQIVSATCRDVCPDELRLRIVQAIQEQLAAPADRPGAGGREPGREPGRG